MIILVSVLFNVQSIYFKCFFHLLISFLFSKFILNIFFGMCLVVVVVVVATVATATVVVLFFTGLYAWGRGELGIPSIMLVPVLPLFKIP